MARSLEERLQDIRQAAIDLRDFMADMETAAFHALPHADRMGFRAVKNALTELGEAVIGAEPAAVLGRFGGMSGSLPHRMRTRRALAS